MKIPRKFFAILSALCLMIMPLRSFALFCGCYATDPCPIHQFCDKVLASSNTYCKQFCAPPCVAKASPPAPQQGYTNGCCQYTTKVYNYNPTGGGTCDMTPCTWITNVGFSSATVCKDQNGYYSDPCVLGVITVNTNICQ